MILPKRLEKGDIVGVIAPASPACMKGVQRGLLFLKELGLRVKMGKHIESVHGYLAGTDTERLADFHEMIADPTIKAIFCARGGYGTARFAMDLDYNLIHQNPKVIWGYSDITYLHTTIRQKSKLITFHGPMIESDLAKDDVDKITKAMFNQLFSPQSIFYSESIAPLEVINVGKVKGELIGGNLTLLTSTLGTPFELDTRGKIIMIEDINEEPYRVDAMLNQWKLAGKLADLAGMIIGDFANAQSTTESFLTLHEIFRHYSRYIDGPVMAGFKIGHCFPHISLPFGVQAKVNTSKKSVIIQPGVT